MKTFQAYNDAASQAVLNAFRLALEPVLERMNQDFLVHHMEVGRREVNYGEVEEVVVKVVLRRPKDFNHQPASDRPRLYNAPT